MCLRPPKEVRLAQGVRILLARDTLFLLRHECQQTFRTSRKHHPPKYQKPQDSLSSVGFVIVPIVLNTP